MKAIIFDLDGTIIDSRHVMMEAWTQVSMHFNLALPFSEYENYIGYSFEDICKKLGIPASQTKEIKKEYFTLTEALQHKVKLTENFRTFLGLCKRANIPTGLVTSKPLVPSKKLLGMFGISTDALVCGDEVICGKPHVESFRLLKQRIIKPERVNEWIYFGDMYVDYQFAVNSGMRFVRCDFKIFNNFPKNLPRQYVTIETWHDAATLIKIEV